MSSAEADADGAWGLHERVTYLIENWKSLSPSEMRDELTSVKEGLPPRPGSDGLRRAAWTLDVEGLVELARGNELKRDVRGVDELVVEASLDAMNNDEEMGGEGS